jgi:threonine synthase
MTGKTDNNNDDDESNNTIICGVNSYNIGRPLMQMVHFIWTYLRVKEQHIENNETKKQKEDNFRLDIVIPTGAMGNIAGCVSN